MYTWSHGSFSRLICVVKMQFWIAKLLSLTQQKKGTMVAIFSLPHFSTLSFELHCNQMAPILKASHVTAMKVHPWQDNYTVKHRLPISVIYQNDVINGEGKCLFTGDLHSLWWNQMMKIWAKSSFEIYVLGYQRHRPSTVPTCTHLLPINNMNSKFHCDYCLRRYFTNTCVSYLVFIILSQNLYLHNSNPQHA